MESKFHLRNTTARNQAYQISYTNPIAWENLPHHWNLSLIYTIWIFIELLFVYFFYVETRGPTLEELARIFDGDDAAVANVDLQQVEKEIHITEKETTSYRERV